ncbi:MAG: hypothetical protein VXZ25_03190, partial [Pseudomonadota bacterium]|nr:hypothetical protein [Pseudomonadota bacterium]
MQGFVLRAWIVPTGTTSIIETGRVCYCTTFTQSFNKALSSTRFCVIRETFSCRVMGAIVDGRICDWTWLCRVVAIGSFVPEAQG